MFDKKEPVSGIFFYLCESQDNLFPDLKNNIPPITISIISPHLLSSSKFFPFKKEDVILH